MGHTRMNNPETYTDNIDHTRHKKKTNKTKNTTQHWKLKRGATQTAQKAGDVNPSALERWAVPVSYKTLAMLLIVNTCYRIVRENTK
jgi:hypothetical protein